MFSSKSKDSAAPPPPTPSSPSGQPKRAAGRSSAPSIISADLVVNGTLTSSGDIQIDGRVEGDVHSAGLVIGEKAFIHGEVLADDVTIRGRIQGSVRARKVLLCSTCHVEGNILHEAFAVEAGAFFEGNCRHSDNPLSDDTGRKGTEYDHRAAPAPSVSATPASAPSMTNGGGAMAARAMDVAQPRPAAATVAPLKPGA